MSSSTVTSSLFSPCSTVTSAMGYESSTKKNSKISMSYSAPTTPLSRVDNNTEKYLEENSQTTTHDDKENDYSKLVPTVSNDTDEDDDDDTVSTITVTTAMTTPRTNTGNATTTATDDYYRHGSRVFDNTPSRQSTAYHLFFQQEHKKAFSSSSKRVRASEPTDKQEEERMRQRRNNWKFVFTISEKWKNMDKQTKDIYEQRAYDHQKLQYQREQEKWQQRSTANTKDVEEDNKEYNKSVPLKSIPPYYYDNRVEDHHRRFRPINHDTRRHKDSTPATKKRKMDYPISERNSKKKKPYIANADTIHSGTSSSNQQHHRTWEQHPSGLQDQWHSYYEHQKNTKNIRNDSPYSSSRSSNDDYDDNYYYNYNSEIPQSIHWYKEHTNANARHSFARDDVDGGGSDIARQMRENACYDQFYMYEGQRHHAYQYEHPQQHHGYPPHFLRSKQRQTHPHSTYPHPYSHPSFHPHLYSHSSSKYPQRRQYPQRPQFAHLRYPHRQQHPRYPYMYSRYPQHPHSAHLRHPFSYPEHPYHLQYQQYMTENFNKEHQWNSSKESQFVSYSNYPPPTTYTRAQRRGLLQKVLFSLCKSPYSYSLAPKEGVGGSSIDGTAHATNTAADASLPSDNTDLNNGDNDDGNDNHNNNDETSSIASSSSSSSTTTVITNNTANASFQASDTNN